jgi:hypothetical protein
MTRQWFGSSPPSLFSFDSQRIEEVRMG